MDMLTAIIQGYIWKISGRAAQQFKQDVVLNEKTYLALYDSRTCWETPDRKVYLEYFKHVTWCLCAREDREDLLKFIKYKFL